MIVFKVDDNEVLRSCRIYLQKVNIQVSYRGGSWDFHSFAITINKVDFIFESPRFLYGEYILVPGRYR